MTHLWEVKHSYYCNEGNFYTSSRDLGPHYKRWSDFLEEWSDSDMDYNLFFRWDWSEENGDGEPTFKGDVNYRNGTLKMFIMGQRKGLYNWVTVEVCRADEPAVIEFLTPRAEYLKALWSPLL